MSIEISFLKKIIITLFVIVVYNLNSQNFNYQFKNLSSSNGLSMNSVITMHQDKLGQMWLGTRDGLNKYDGNKFTVYRNKISDSTSISNDNILSIEEDTEGFLWVGTFNGLNKYDPLKNKFKKYVRVNNKYLGSNRIWAVKEIDNEVWIGTTNGISVFKKGELQPKCIDIYVNGKKGKKSFFIIKIIKNNDGKIWVATKNKGLLQLNKRDEEKLYFTSYTFESDTNEKLVIQDIITSENGNIWVATKTQGLLLYDAVSQKLVIPKNDTFNNSKSKDCRGLTFDNDKNLWVGTNTGVYVYNQKGDLKSSLETEKLNKVKSIYKDTNGSIWIGSYYGGVNFWDKKNHNFNRIHANDPYRTLNFNVVSSIAEGEAGKIYIATEGDGITVLDSLNNKVAELKKGLNTKYIKSLLFFNSTYLIIGTFSKGIQVYNLQTKKMEPSFLPKELVKKIEKTSVYSLEKENDNTLWIGTFGEGVFKVDIAQKTYATTKTNALLISNRIRDLKIDSQKRVWIATQKGLNSIANIDNYDFKETKVETYFYEDINDSGVDILTVFEDSSKHIWIGTKDKGLYKFNKNKFEKIAIESMSKNNAVKTIYGILEGKHKNLWLSTNMGIVKYNYGTEQQVNYNSKEGVNSNEFIENAFLKRGSNFYFGGSSGVTFFNENEVYINQYSPEVILTDFKIENNAVPINEKGILEKHISYTKHVELDHKSANFAISFAKPNFINSENNIYKYRLIGLQDDWITTSNTETNFTIQKAGSYIFEVKGANNDLIWNDNSTKLTIKVNASPWKSWWAYTIYFTLLLASIFIVLYFLKTKTNLQHKLELEYVEKQRKEELNKSKLEFFTDISHEFRTPLTLILGPIQQILLDYSGSNKMYKKLQIVENNANHLLQLINRLMDFRKVESNYYKLQAAEGNIVKFLKEIYFSFTEYAKDKGYNYELETSNDTILVYYDRNKLEKVFYNLLSNAFKYTPENGTIKMNISHDDRNIIIQVEDNGIGISTENINKIFDRFYNVKSIKKIERNKKNSTGIGLSIVKKMIDLHKGEITVENKDAKGVVFSVKLPLGRAHLQDDDILTDFKISDDIFQYKSQLPILNIEMPEDIEANVIDENKQTILLVEDYKPLRLFIKDLLKTEYNVVEAENGKKGLEKANQIIPDLIISDVVMPKMVGTELCSKIKENINTSHIPVILLTSRSSLIYRLEGLEKGADEYISKPFNIQEFLLKVKNILSLNNKLKNKLGNEDNFLPEEVTVSTLDEKLLKEAFRIVNENIANENFDIPFFSSELGLSRTMLFMKIKAWSNLTPLEFIQNIRMKKAARLLEIRKYNISQISYKVGFKNPKYFSKKFKAKYGLSPIEYQNKFFDELTD